jgi:hypothetical protein
MKSAPVTTHLPQAAGSNQFILSINGQTHTYSQDKTGKRQAILDGLAVIETITVDDTVYLPSEAALQVVAAVLYPGGIQMEAAYKQVCEVTEKACAHIGYGTEMELSPPAVPFAARGAYRQQVPPVDAQMIQEELELAGISSTHPRQEVACTILWNKAGLAVYGRHWSQLTPPQQERIQTQVDAIAQQAGWQKDESTTTSRYAKPLPIDEAAARSRLNHLLRQADGRPVTVSKVIHQAQVGAYGRGFYSDELAPDLQAIVTEILQANGYRPTPESGEYCPLPVSLSPSVTDIPERLAALSPVTTTLGQGLLLRDVLTAVGASNQPISQWQAEQLLQSEPLRQALWRLGYQAELSWCQSYHFQPKLDSHEAHLVILKELQVQHDPDKKLSLAKGLAVYTPALVIDDMDETLIYLEMIGHKQSVKANWAALVGGNKVHWLGRQRISLEGMKAHVKIQTTLPCGWTDHILLHKQASLKEMNPEQPFYLLDDGTQPIPPLFYAMLNKALALPLLLDWAAYLWANGRLQKLISLLDEGHGQGYAAWRVLPAAEAWQAVIQTGLIRKQIWF